jgi:uncharacterized Ntn-hydrolase superfamily protein
LAQSLECQSYQPLLCALEAGIAAGWERKQRKSAVLLVVHRQSFLLVDLRVELDPQPLA